MKLLIVGIISASLLSVLADSATSTGAPAATESHPAGTEQKLLVLDVRTAEEFNRGHIQGATNVPIQELEKRIEQVAPNKTAPIAVHCQGGGRSARAKKLLDGKGYTNVEDLGSLANAREKLEKKQPR